MIDKVKKKITTFDEHGIVFGILCIFFVIFFVITSVSPLSGDDWAYAVMSRDMHPIMLVWEHYFTWSGRLLSELWGFTITRNKWIYDLLNPVIFTSIFVLLLKNAEIKKHPVVSCLLTFYLIFSVDEYVRMQTYTWCMGETYIIPLLLFLIYARFLRRMLFDTNGVTNRQLVLMRILCVCIPLYMENAAGMLVGANLLALGYCWFVDRKHCKTMFLLFMCSLIGTAVIGLSPGAQNRMVTTQEWFSSMSLIQKIRYNQNSFLKFTFTRNQVLILVLSLTFLILLFAKRKKYPFAKWHIVGLALPFLFGVLQSQSELLTWTYGQYWLRILCDYEATGCTMVLTIGYAFWIIDVLYVLWTYLEGQKRWFAIWIFLCAGGANLVMLISPIFDARSSVYTIFLLILLTLLLFEEIDLKETRLKIFCCLILVGICIPVLQHYFTTYYEVYRANNERMFQIRGFAEDPTVKELYIVRMPKMSIHSSDVEEGDEYHATYFRKYYNLSPDTNLYFYYRGDYSYYGEEIY